MKVAFTSTLLGSVSAISLNSHKRGADLGNAFDGVTKIVNEFLAKSQDARNELEISGAKMEQACKG